MASTEPEAPAPLAPESRAHRWTWWAIRWLPVLILVSLSAGATSAVVGLAPSSAATPVLTAASDIGAPVLSLRRDLDPFVDEVADRRLIAALDAFVATQPPDTCLVVRGDDIDFAHRADDPQVPASAQKLVTAVAALTVLGPDSTYRTSVVTAGAPAGGTVTDLYLVGGGDPLLATDTYAARYRNQPQPFTDLAGLADAVVAAGVRRIEGSVVADESRYDTVRYHPAWPARFITQKQTGPLSAVAVNDGFVAWPPASGVAGTPAPDPAVLGAEVLGALLVERGVEVVGPAAAGPAPPAESRHEIAAIESPPMREVVAEMVRESDNATAELVLKELGIAGSQQGTWDAGAATAAAALAGLGLDRAGIRISDGSGLSPDNVATCDLLVDILEVPVTAELIESSLARVGQTGTLARRWTDTELVGRVAAKTGTLNQVTALVGTTLAPDPTTSDGPSFRFALVVNVEEPAVIQAETVRAQELLADLLTFPPGGPDLEPLRP